LTSLVQIREELDAKRKELHEVWEQAGPERDFDRVTLLGQGSTEEKLTELRRRDAVINDLSRKEADLSYAERIANDNERAIKASKEPANGIYHPGASGEKQPFRPGDLRKTLQDDRQYKAFRDGNLRAFSLDLPGINWKTIITVGSMQPQAARGATQDMGVETRTVMDLMMQGSTDRAQIDYFEETTLTNAADTVAESGLKPESALAWTLRTETVRKIATYVPMTKESLDDIPMVESLVRGRLAYMVQRAEEAQILSGNGVAPNITGILARSVQTQAKGADPTPDAVYKAMQLVRGSAGSGFSEPSAVVFHPNDWTAVKLLRTLDGIYIWGNPSDEGPDRIWGLPVRVTTAMTENTALVGAFSTQAEVFRREGINITVATEDGSDFLYNRVKVMAESRLALAVYRPSAFATVTGI
jgi:HK97 family phage major capsid protein